VTEGPARRAALDALLAVDRGVKVADALDQEAARHRLERDDRRLMTQLVYGVLRHRRLLDWWIDPWLRRPVDPVVRDILRLAFYQAAFLERVPRYAVVSSAVELAKRRRPEAQGLVNAVLRRGLDHRPDPADPAVRHSFPDWLVERWRTRWPEHVEQILERANRVPPLTLRVAPPRSAAEVAAELGSRGVSADPSPLLPDAVRVEGPLWLEDWPLHQQGHVVVQDEASQLVTWVLDPKPGERILDLAAGLGGKTFHILDRAPGAEVVAVDTNPARLQRLQERLADPARPRSVDVWPGDGRHLPRDWANRFDRVLLDAPCSNLGVVRRRPDARWRKTPQDLTRLQDIEAALLIEAVRVVRPGGIVVYSVCSTEPEETVGVVRAVREAGVPLEPESVAPWLPHDALKALAGPEGLLLPPGVLGLDGFFIARFRKPTDEGV
jgi:16S rRNA (cytosine967-C5)-methyltransferase